MSRAPWSTATRERRAAQAMATATAQAAATRAAALNDHRASVIVAKYGTVWRWWPNPESRRGGSQRWSIPAVEKWHTARSIAALPATRKARE